MLLPLWGAVASFQQGRATFLEIAATNPSQAPICKRNLFALKVIQYKNVYKILSEPKPHAC